MFFPSSKTRILRFVVSAGKQLKTTDDNRKKRKNRSSQSRPDSGGIYQNSHALLIPKKVNLDPSVLINSTLHLLAGKRKSTKLGIR